MKPLTNPILHELAYALRFIGMRDRLRCPKCKAVGTWKPHGGTLDRIYDHLHNEYETRLDRRWLCKWCGHYVGPEGILKAHVNTEKNVWGLPEVESDWTPADQLRKIMGKVWPWRG